MRHLAAVILACSVPILTTAAIWTWDARWLLTALITGTTAIILTNTTSRKSGDTE